MLRIATTDLRTGDLLCDDLPCEVTDMSTVLMDHGELSLSMNSDEIAPYREAVIPGRTCVWALNDDVPIWGGILWTRERKSLIDTALDLHAQTFGTLFSQDHRVISEGMSWTAAHPYTVFQGIVAYALGKTGAELGNFAGFSQDGFVGTPIDRAYVAKDYSDVWGVLTGLANDCGFEFDFLIDPGSLLVTIRLAEELNSPNPEVPTLSYPGNVIDADMSLLTAGSSTRVYMTGEATDETVLTSTVTAEDLISFGWPLLEKVITSGTQKGVSQTELDRHAAVALAELRQSRTLQEVTVTTQDEGVVPGQIKVGDRVNLSLADELEGNIEGQRRVGTITYEISSNEITALKLGLEL